ncbi:MAG: hypothetical protein U9R19_16690 [Bacteroidota bacterium]|nr:hypothetical protein [Bacteroidota bacterium]
MLTKDQTNWIRQNIRNRGIETIDLEHEMLDHISMAVIEKMEEGLSFREAYKSVLLTFGPFGLQKLQNLKYRQLRKKGYRMIYQNLGEYLKPPKIALTFLIAVVLYALYSFGPIKIYVFTSVLLAALVAPVIYFIASKKLRPARKKYSQLSSFHQIHGSGYFIIIYPMFMILPNNIEHISNYWAVFYSMIPVILCFAFFVSLKQSIAEIENDYPAEFAPM